MGVQFSPTNATGQLARLKALLNADASKGASVTLKVVDTNTAATCKNPDGSWDVVIPSRFDVSQPGNADIVLGMVVHEDGHHLYTDISLYQKAASEKAGHILVHVLNAFDDIQQEHQKRSHKPGHQYMLSRMYDCLVKCGFYTADGEGINLAMKLAFHAGHALTNGYPAHKALAVELEKALRAEAGSEFTDKVLGIANETQQLMSTADALSLARRFLKLVLQESDKPQAPEEALNQQADDNQAEGDNADDSGQETSNSNSSDGADDSQDGDSQSGSASDGDDGDDQGSSSDGSSGDVNGGQGETGPDNAGSAQETNEPQTDANSGDAGSNGSDQGGSQSDTQRFRDQVLDQINNQRGAQSISSLDAGSAVEAYVASNTETGVRGNYREDAFYLPAIRVCSELSERYGHGSFMHFSELDAKAASAGLASSLRKLLASEDRVQKRYRENGKRIARKKAARIMTGDTKVFVRKHRAEAANTAVAMLVDTSGSMCGLVDVETDLTRQRVANEATFALASAIESIPGNLTALYQFSSNATKRKSFMQKAKANAVRFYGMTPSGGTDLSAALEPAFYDLLRQDCARKVVIILTDGATTHPEKAAGIVNAMYSFGIDTYGFAIESQGVLRNYLAPQNIVEISDVKALRYAMFELAKKALISPPRG